MHEAGASNEEIQRAISDTVAVRENTKELMESHGLHHLGITKDLSLHGLTEKSSRITELVSIAASFALNCTSSLEQHIATSRSLGITDEEVKSVLDAAFFIKGEAAHYVEQMVKLEKKYDELQQLYEELQRTQAMLVQSEKMAALGKLVATVLHEMNTPVGVMNSGFNITMRSIDKIEKVIKSSQTLEEVRSSKIYKNSLDTIHDNLELNTIACERINKIVKSLKSFSHLDEAKFQKIDIHDCIENVLTLLESDFGDRISLFKDYGDIPETPCYPSELSQMFMHLLTNATKAITEEGRITISTFLEGKNVNVKITDDGVGISQCKLQQLFEPDFSQVGSRVKAGLGLFTSYNIMQKHQGSIKVESEIGKGSVFTISFPTDLEEKSELHKEIKPEKLVSRCDRLKT